MAEADEAWLEALYRAHADPIHRYAAQRVGYEEAADVVGDTFAVAWQKRRRIPRDAERAWLFGVARKETLRRGRSSARGSMLYARLLAERPIDVADHSDGVSARIDVYRALASLRATDRDILLTTLWTDLKPAEVAAVLGLSRSTYAVKLHRARRRLVRVLDDAGSGLALLTEMRAA
jgi:RNA polymerase sigma factor (sigma-70 family)